MAKIIEFPGAKAPEPKATDNPVTIRIRPDFENGQVTILFDQPITGINLGLGEAEKVVAMLAQAAHRVAHGEKDDDNA